MNYHDKDVVPLNVAERAQRFVLEEFASIEVSPAADCVVDRVIPAHGLVVIYGEPKSGKSFFASCMALHVALGSKFGGKTVQPGPVVYVSAEGASGFRKRLVAFREHEGIAEVVPFYLIAEAPDLGSRTGDARLLIDCIRDKEPKLVVIDTLARSMCGADENSASDMGAFIANCEMIASELDCVVVVVHHSGKDSSRGTRGSNSLNAAVNAEIHVTNDQFQRTARLTKMKDDEDGWELGFHLERVEFEAHEQAVTSCVVTVLKDWHLPSSSASKAEITGAASVALKALQKAIEEVGESLPDNRHTPDKLACTLDDWCRYCEQMQITKADTPDAKRKAFQRAAKKLQHHEIIEISNNKVWIND